MFFGDVRCQSVHSDIVIGKIERTSFGNEGEVWRISMKHTLSLQDRHCFDGNAMCSRCVEMEYFLFVRPKEAIFKYREPNAKISNKAENNHHNKSKSHLGAISKTEVAAQHFFSPIPRKRRSLTGRGPSKGRIPTRFSGLRMNVKVF